MKYRVIDNAPNSLLRTKVFTNKKQAVSYAKSLKRELALGYQIYIDNFAPVSSDGYYRFETINAIGNHKNVKYIKTK